jgi:hypothetical protein
MPIWVYFGVPWNGERWYVLWPFVMSYGPLVRFVVIWCILWLFGTCCVSFGTFFRFSMSGNPAAAAPFCSRSWKWEKSLQCFANARQHRAVAVGQKVKQD